MNVKRKLSKCYLTFLWKGLFWGCRLCGYSDVLLFLSLFTGYFCRSGATVATPENTTLLSDNTTTICPPGTFNYTDAGPCPAGFYCPIGTAEPEKCPPGTFSNKTKLFAIEQCENCTAGEYCETYNLVKADRALSRGVLLSHRGIPRGPD